MIDTIQQTIVNALPLTVKLGSALVLALMISCLIWLAAYYLQKGLRRTRYAWDDTFIASLHLPLQVFIWLYTLCGVIEILQPLIHLFIFRPYLPKVRLLAFTICIIWFLLRYIARLEVRLLDAEHAARFSKASTLALGRIFRVSVGILAVLLILQILGVPLGGLLTFGGAGALIIGLAGKSMLENYLGGLMIYTDRIFTVGDWISSPDRQIEGTVDQIGWRQTRILTLDRQPLYVPNSVFSSLIVKNTSRRLHRGIQATIGLRYQDLSKIANITEACRQLLIDDPEIDHRQTNYVRFTEFATSSINMEIYCFTTKTQAADFMRVQENLLLKMAAIIEKHGAETAFTTITIHQEVST